MWYPFLGDKMSELLLSPLNPLDVCEYFLSKDVIPLHKKLRTYSWLDSLKKYIASIETNRINGTIGNVVCYTIDGDIGVSERSILKIRYGKNCVIILYNRRFNIASVEDFCGEKFICKYMISLLRYIIPA